jgi:predicted ribosome quality control (RQC) complex YloA/Tae2 family protein
VKPYHQTELEDFVQWADEELKTAQLQDIESYESALCMSFYIKGRGSQWLVLDFNNNTPMALLLDRNPFGYKKSTRPVSLFLKAHAKNLHVKKISSREGMGRVFDISLDSSNRHCMMEVRLIPKAPNLLVTTEEKSISWNKPKDLVKIETPEAEEVRSIVAIHKEWLAGLRKPEAGDTSPELKLRKKLEKDLERKRKALTEINKHLDSKESDEWYQLGELLKTQKLSDIGHEWDIYLDRKRSQSWNLQQAFHKAKLVAKKRKGTFDRKKIVEDEIHTLENQMEGEIERLSTAQPALPKRKNPTEVRSRKKELESGAIAFLGKSAADNMKILRQSQAWDIWLHLRDYPSAHAVIQRNKNQEISRDELNQVALWLAQESLQKKILLDGARLEIVYTECRHVRPIKGDKLGRVHYQNERHFMLVVT